MKVILTQKVRFLGDVGDVVNVSPGLGRNYLFPRGLAAVANESNRREMGHHRKRLAKKMDEHAQMAKQLAEKLSQHNVELVRKVTPGGRLFGAVTALELARALEEAGFDVEKRHLRLEAPIKGLGEFEVRAHLFQGVEATFQVTVSQDPNQKAQMEEEKKQKQLQKAAKAPGPQAQDESSPKGEEGLTEQERLDAEVAKVLRS